MSEVRLYSPAELNRSEWWQLQSIARDAFGSALTRSPDEINTLVGWSDPNRFYASHLDPNTEVGRRYNANQLYTRPRVAVATEDHQLVGFAYSAHNVSGGGPPEGPHNTSLKAELVRNMKKLSIVKNNLWLREIAVKPEYQRQGIAKELGKALLKDAIGLQPVTAYIWPEESPAFIEDVLERLGFMQTGEQPVKVFGEKSASIMQVRMKAPSVRSVLKNL